MEIQVLVFTYIYVDSLIYDRRHFDLVCQVALLFSILEAHVPVR